MIPWINLDVLLAASLLFLVFYVLSVSPAALERRLGPAVYRLCGRLRIVAGILEAIVSANYVVYTFYPLPIHLARAFPWPWWVSAIIAVGIGVPAGYLMARGLKDAGAEAIAPRKEHTMYGGIYEKMRHPQAVGEMPLFWAMAFLLHSPFLVLYSFVFIPIFGLMCWAEERDLLIRYGAAYAEYRERTGASGPRRAWAGRMTR